MTAWSGGARGSRVRLRIARCKRENSQRSANARTNHDSSNKRALNTAHNAAQRRSRFRAADRQGRRSNGSERNNRDAAE